MRLLIFVILVTAFTAVTPQNEGRTRARGLRRFSLSTPALKAAKTTDGNELFEENLTDPQTPPEPQTRSRGASSLRRSRPSSLRLRGRTSDQAEASPDTASDVTVTNVEPSEASEGRRGGAGGGGGGGGGGLRIRRPLKKITTTTTTTTTTTEQSIAENVATELSQDMQHSTSANEHAKEKQVEGMLTEESNAVLKDEVMQDKSEKMMTEKKMDKPLVQEEPVQEEAISEPVPENLPKIKKLRPIPIKIRRRGKEGKPQVEESPIEIPNNEPEQPEAAGAKPVSSHRFSPRPRPRLQTRKRPINRESALGTETESEPVVSTAAAAAEQNERSEAAQRLRSRGDVPNLRRPSRVSSRQKPAEVVETQPENSFVDVAPEEAQPESRSELFGRRSRG